MGQERYLAGHAFGGALLDIRADLFLCGIYAVPEMVRIGKVVLADAGKPGCFVNAVFNYTIVAKTYKNAAVHAFNKM